MHKHPAGRLPLPMHGLMFPGLLLGPTGSDGAFAGHADQVGRPTAQVNVAAELRLFLKPAHRTGPVLVGCDGVSSLGHVVQSLGIPLTEVGRLTVNGRPVPPRHRPGVTCPSTTVTVIARHAEDRNGVRSRAYPFIDPVPPATRRGS